MSLPKSDPFDLESYGADYGDEEDYAADHGADYGAWGFPSHFRFHPVTGRPLRPAAVHPALMHPAVRRAIQEGHVLPSHLVAHGGKPAIPEVVRQYMQGGSRADGGVEYTPIPSNPTNVASGASATFTASPQAPHRIDTFTIANAIDLATGLENWGITSLKVGKDPMFTADGSMPGSMFDAKSVNTNKLRGKTATPGMTLSVSVTRTTASANAIAFSGGFSGPTID